ncbi:MAG: AbrB/MazE/SpoVT family DNA-binding domain-containing protein [Candidatus Aenigmarchaeota archaeon]|nr:AbrB/MazE/SpoVT family DNA-binding domain-containing protein [Candidatus Aenigmarchaeota archaeon]
MRKKLVKLDLPRGSIKVEGYQCPKCGEEIFTHGQALKGEEAAMKKGIWGEGLWLQRKVTTIGNSPAVVIPKDIARHLHIKKGKPIKIRIVKDEIVIKPR